MKKFHHIIAAVDFTPSCLHALREAVRRASLDQAKVTAVHVMDERLVHELKAALSTTEAAVRAEWEAKLRKFVDESSAGGGLVKIEVRVGHPFDELVDACQRHGADLLVMGAKGSGTEPSRIGVIAAKCIRHAPVDVLVVRHDAEPPFKQVLACVDFSENAAKAVQFALHVAEQDKASVTCLFVYQSATMMALDYGGFVTPLPPVVTDEQALQSWEKELDAFITPLVQKAGDVPVKQLVVEQVNIREAILEHVKQTQTDLVVVGTRGKNSLRHLLIGTTAEKIVQHAPCSILAVKPDDVVAAAGGS
jgi:nucleotide-binding universal stress UspA family protein